MGAFPMDFDYPGAKPPPGYSGKKALFVLDNADQVPLSKGSVRSRFGLLLLLLLLLSCLRGRSDFFTRFQRAYHHSRCQHLHSG